MILINRRLISAIIACMLCLYAMTAETAFNQQNAGGARPMGFGGAFSAVADTTDSIFYNPAGLYQIKRPEVMGTYGKLYAGLDDDSNLSNGSVAFSLPLKRKRDTKNIAVVAFGMNMFSLQQYYTESSFGVYAAHNIYKALLIGAGLKYLTVSYGSDEYTASNPVFNAGMTKSNTSMDLGLLMPLDKYWYFALTARDFNSPDMGLKYEDKVKPAYTFASSYRQSTYIFSCEMLSSSDIFRVFLGGEKWIYSNKFAIRAALGIGNKKYSRLNLGGSYDSGTVVIDYAFLYPLSGLSETFGTHALTFGYRFGLTEKQNIEEAKKLYEAAMLKTGSGDIEGAKKDLEQAILRDSVQVKYTQAWERLDMASGIVPEIKIKGHAEQAAAEGIRLYVFDKNNRKAVNFLLYSYSLNNDKNIEKLTDKIARESSIEIDNSAKTWNLAEQKIFQALERFKRKKYDETIKLCEEALELEPGNVTAYKRLGSTFLILKDTKRAKENLTKALELSPNDPDAPQIREILKNLK